MCVHTHICLCLFQGFDLMRSREPVALNDLCVAVSPGEKLEFEVRRAGPSGGKRNVKRGTARTSRNPQGELGTRKGRQNPPRSCCL